MILNTLREFNNIVLFAGETKPENMPTGYFSSTALIMLRGKPVIWRQMENLKNQGINKVILVLNKKNIKLVDYTQSILSKSFNIKVVLAAPEKSILNSFNAGLQKVDLNLPTRVILGDTLITKSINNETDVVFTYADVGISDYWCLAETDKNGVIQNFYDKQKQIDTANKQTVVGYYSFSDTELILSCSAKALIMSKKELSGALDLYKEKINLKGQTIDDWYDLGHTSGIVEAKKSMFNTRSFNSININTDIGTLSKTSSEIQKLRDEAIWYSNLPQEFAVLTPRLISFSENSESATLTQELYGYPSLSEMYLSGEINLEDWKKILKELFKLHARFEKYVIETDKQAMKWLYLTKTKERIEKLKTQNEFWREIFDRKTIKINGQDYKNISAMIDNIEKFALELIASAISTICHGDYCFSNILFDSSNYIFKLIDPRGRLNKEPTIYGDPRYDIAKLRHSVCGFYDFIVNGLFCINETRDGFNYDILLSRDYSKSEKIFDGLAAQNGFNCREIKFIEGLLFLSMLPLHSDDLDRQKMFYLKAVVLLNEVINQNFYTVMN